MSTISRHSCPTPANAALRDGARRYRRQQRLVTGSPRIDLRSVTACPALGRAIADAYLAAPVFESTAVPAYRALREETWRQLDYLTRPRHQRGLGFTVVISPLDPYRSVSELLTDLADRRLRIWATAASDNQHPLLSEHDNDAFRAVHDAFGHGATGRGFDQDGEEAAWWKHQAMYSPLARRALLTETRGQTCALFYGPQTGFAVQKAALLDERFGTLGTLHRRPCDGRCLA